MAEGNNPVFTVSSSSNKDVNEQFLASLIEMGIDQEAARQALRIVNNRSLEDALAIVFGESISSNNDTRVEQSTQISESNIIPTDLDITDESVMTYKMLFVVNGSLRMSSGKMSAQVAHCAIDLYHQLIEKRLISLNYWREYGETKIVVRGNSTEELLEIQSRAKTNKSIITSVIEDAGRTEIASGSITCVGLFGTNKQLDPITGHLKLMQDCLKCSGSNTQQKN